MSLKTSGIAQIQRAALILMVGTILADGVSFVKSLLIALFYGTSANLDAYVLSLTPVRLVGGVLIGGLQVALIPKYLELREKKGDGQAFAFLGTSLLWTCAAAGVLMLALVVESPRLARLLGTGFSAAQIDVTAHLLNIASWFLLFSLLSGLGRCVLQAHRSFWLTGLLPAVNGLVSLAYIALFHAQGVAALLYGMIFGMAIQAAITGFALRRWIPPAWSLLPLFHPAIRQLSLLMWPLLIGSALVHVNEVVDQIMASTLPAGSIAALHYANKLHNIVTQAFIMVVSQASLPFLAQQAAQQDFQALKHTFLRIIIRTACILIPLSLGIVFFGEFAVQVVFQRGAFTNDSTVATSGAWIAYTLGLPGQAVGILTARMYNVLQDNLTLMYVSSGGIVLNILFNWILMRYWGHVGIALSTAGVYTAATLVLLYRLRKKFQMLCAEIPNS